MNLQGSLSTDLYSWSVNYSKISDVVLAIDIEDHKLGFPKLFIVGDNIVIDVSLSNLELS